MIFHDFPIVSGEFCSGFSPKAPPGLWPLAPGAAMLRLQQPEAVLPGDGGLRSQPTGSGW